MVEGVNELPFFLGAGFRLYFTEDDDTFCVALWWRQGQPAPQHSTDTSLLTVFGRNIKFMADYRTMSERFKRRFGKNQPLIEYQSLRLVYEQLSEERVVDTLLAEVDARGKGAN